MTTDPEFRSVVNSVDWAAYNDYNNRPNKWTAQTCTGGCSGMDYGPFKDLLECIEKMTKLGVRFTCGYDCDTGYSGFPNCKKVRKYMVIERYGKYQAVPIR